ncbi:MAG: hypothetical protein ABI678_07440 [Kofleriaceae bacterium]
MAYRNDVEALEARKAALEYEVEAKTRERDQAARLLHDAKLRSMLPVLDDIRIASPCTADWNTMTGDERVRHCGACKKDVYNLSNLRRDEAEALIREKHGDLCARYYQRGDGTIILADCTIGKKQQRRRRVIAVGAAAMLASGVALAYKLTREHQPPARDDMDMTAVAGGVSFDPGPPESRMGQVTAPQQVLPVKESK